jgi:Tetracyclin repressor-like, C-terminal domain
MTLDRLSQESPMPDTGTLEGDLFAWGCRIAGTVTGADGPVLLRAVIQAKPGDRAMLLRRGEEIQVMLDRATARGEPHLDYEDTVDGLVAPIMLRQLLGIQGLSDDFVRVLVRRTISFGSPRRGK